MLILLIRDLLYLKNILYYLSPIADQELLIKLIEISEEKRDIGLWNFEI